MLNGYDNDSIMKVYELLRRSNKNRSAIFTFVTSAEIFLLDVNRKMCQNNSIPEDGVCVRHDVDASNLSILKGTLESIHKVLLIEILVFSAYVGC